MPSNETFRVRVVADFLMTARRHFGLPATAPRNIRPTPLSRLRPMLRSLLVAGSLGTVLTQPTFAAAPVFPVNECKDSESSSKRDPSAQALPAQVAPTKNPAEH